MTPTEIDRLADGFHHLRPDWPTQQLRTLLTTPALRDRPRRDVMVALSWVAAESGTASPYRVLEAGPWWRAAAIDGQVTSNRDNPGPGERCSVCSLSEARCRQLWANDHDYVPATQTRAWKSDPARAKTVTDALRAEVQPLRDPAPPIDLAERQQVRRGPGRHRPARRRPARMNPTSHSPTTGGTA